MAETVIYGVKYKLYPNAQQAALFDLWRRRCLSLWNLLLELEQAAYSGDKSVREELKWRQIWIDVAQENYQRDLHVWDHGRAGKRAKEPGRVLLLKYEKQKKAYDEIHAPYAKILAQYERDLAAWEAAGKAGKKPQKPKKPEELTNLKEPKKPEKPEPPSAEWCAKVLKGRDGTLYFDEPDEDGVLQDKCYQPRLFIWKRDLLAILARLKKIERVRWVGDLPSHAAQKTAADLTGAIEAMLRERKKAKAGMPARKTGFPKFKKTGRYATGSVYFANTQLAFEFDGDHIKFPGGVGLVKIAWADRQGKACSDPASLNENHKQRQNRKKLFKTAKLMGGRILRQGDDWLASCQWEKEKEAPLPQTGKIAGVKIAARKLITTFDDSGNIKEYLTPDVDERLARRHKLAVRKMLRRMAAQTKKKGKLAARPKNVNGGEVRLRRSRGFFQAAARCAALQALDSNRRNDNLHKLTAGIVAEFDAIQVHRMAVAPLMTKRKMHSKRKRLKRHEGAPSPKARSLKSTRQLMRRALMGRARQLLAYKGPDRGRNYAETPQEFPDVQQCFACHGLNPQFKDGRRITRCVHCSERLVRNVNAAINEFEILEDRLEEAKDRAAR